jgi:hypothetical protein
MRRPGPGGGRKVFHSVENFFPLCGKIAKKFSIVWKNRAVFSTVWKIIFHSVENVEPRFPAGGARALVLLLSAAGAFAAEPPPIERLAIWCEFMPYAEVEAQLPTLAEYECDLILHVERESFSDPDFAKLLRAAERRGVGVDAWLLLPYEKHLYVGQASVKAVRGLARRAADYFGTNRLKVRAFVFDCEPSPLLGRELFAAARALSWRRLERALQEQVDASQFRKDTAALNELVAELRGRGYAVDGAANRAFLDAQDRGNAVMEDALNAPVSGVEWDALSFITYRYQASALSYVAMLNRYATLAKHLYGTRAAIDVGLIGNYDGIPQNAERAELFGGGEAFYAYLRGMRSADDLEEAVGTVLGCGVRRVNLYALDGAVSSVAGLEDWLKAARRARPLSAFARWTPARSLQYGALGALTEKSSRWLTGESEKTNGTVERREPSGGAGERQP